MIFNVVYVIIHNIYMVESKAVLRIDIIRFEKNELNICLA